MKRKTHEDYILEIRNKYNEEYEIIEQYSGAKVPIMTKHIKCGHSWAISPTNLLSGYGCPNCNGGSLRTKENFSNIINKLYPEKFIILGQYKDSRTPILVKHIECNNEFMISPDNLKRRGTCTICENNSYFPKISKSHEFIKDFLININIPFSIEKSFDDCIYKRKLRFDFCVYDKDLNILFLIEYDGQSHFNLSQNEKLLKASKERDLVKTNYCKVNNIQLLRFNYKQSPHEISEILYKYIKDMIQNNGSSRN